MGRSAVLVASVALGGASPALAGVRPVSLTELAQSSAQIVSGSVLRVHRVSGVRVAEVEVAETLKGVPVAKLYFLAQPTWICDITGADLGEKTLLFLEPSDGTLEFQNLPPGDGEFRKAPENFRRALDRLRGSAPFFVVARAGRGHMPVRVVEDREVATVWTTDVVLPTGTPTSPGPEPEYAFIRSVPVDKLRELVRDATGHRGPRAAEQGAAPAKARKEDAQ